MFARAQEIENPIIKEEPAQLTTAYLDIIAAYEKVNGLDKYRELWKETEKRVLQEQRGNG